MPRHILVQITPTSFPATVQADRASEYQHRSLGRTDYLLETLAMLLVAFAEHGPRVRGAIMDDRNILNCLSLDAGTKLALQRRDRYSGGRQSADAKRGQLAYVNSAKFGSGSHAYAISET